jgi:hypothetical protein
LSPNSPCLDYAEDTGNDRDQGKTSMNRSFAAALTIAAAVVLPGAVMAPVLAQGVFPPPPPPGQVGVFPAPPPPGQQGVFPGAPPPGQQAGPASAPGGFGPPPQAMAAVCNNFVKLKDEAEKKALVMQSIGKNHGDRKSMCDAVTHFTAAETVVVKFLVDNKTTCNVPDQAIAAAKTNHDHTVKFRDTICAEAPQPKPPTLSDALGAPMLDTAKNTKTGRGTFDTLTGNPLAK